MSILTSLFVIFFNSSSSWVISLPRIPMITPGRDVLICNPQLLGCPFYNNTATPAFFNLVFIYERTSYPRQFCRRLSCHRTNWHPKTL
jgi:hypothetical protein